MLNSIKISLKDTIVYGLGNIAVKIVGLILITIYKNPKYFSTNDFGVLGILEISGLVLTAFLGSGLPQSLTRWFWDKEHAKHQKGIFFMSLSSQITISTLFCILLIPASDKLSQLIFSNTNYARVLTLVILASGIQSVNTIINTLMRLQSKSLLYTITNLIKLITVLSLTLFFIINRKMGLDGIYLAQVIGNSFTILILVGYTVKNAIIFFDAFILKSMNKYGFPLLLANVAAAALNVIDRFSLNSLTILKSVALYTLAYKISSVLKLVFSDSTRLALSPLIFKKMGAPNNGRFYSKVMLYSSFVIMVAIVGISLFSLEIIKLIATSKDFWGAVIIVPVLSLSVYFVNLKEVSVYGLHIAKKTRIIGFIVVFSTIISLALNLLLIPVWDITGAAVATLLSQVIYWLACYYFSQKVFFVPYEIRKILVMLLIGTILSFSGLLFNGMHLLPRLLIKSGLFIVFPFSLYFFNFYEPVELQAIKGFLVKWSNIGNLKKNLLSLRGINEDN
jgi:O-antigen/teichoic acid export membrane protein